MPRTIIAGNWKMNGLQASLSTLGEIAAGVDARKQGALALICLPATLIAGGRGAVSGSALALGGQACHGAAAGAHTGDISAEMLADAGADYVICGHSERRANHGETDAMVRASVAAAVRAGLTPIVCVGETLAERRANQVDAVVLGQLAGSLPDTAGPARLVIAYEPVWAIGTGETASPAQAGEVHRLIRADLIARFGTAGADISLLYGGSMNPANAADLLATPDINGGLIGGASLKAADFLAIYASAT
jgi:triosephosphate isomerase (TIM)